MNLVLAVTGATGAYAARRLLDKSPWPVALIVSQWGREVYKRECGDIDELTSLAAAVYDDKDLSAPIASGSVPTEGMIILPCSTSTVGKIASGVGDTLITRAAHCHLKESRKLVLCVRESPWSLIDLDAARTVSAAGGVIMPISPAFYMTSDHPPEAVTLDTLLNGFVDHVLALFGRPADKNWESVR
ncbi:MAG: UbiX family flavin prenyltransferase [Phycisphaerae bacterium]|jgi:4-hydroxy-3-polyprenylbenzoate decarboxylase|nr:UbiX family flavin prenyltransferase [Phycisphaerae bacterium]